MVWREYQFLTCYLQKRTLVGKKDKNFGPVGQRMHEIRTGQRISEDFPAFPPFFLATPNPCLGKVYRPKMNVT